MPCRVRPYSLLFLASCGALSNCADSTRGDPDGGPLAEPRGSTTEHTTNPPAPDTSVAPSASTNTPQPSAATPQLPTSGPPSELPNEVPSEASSGGGPGVESPNPVPANPASAGTSNAPDPVDATPDETDATPDETEPEIGAPSDVDPTLDPTEPAPTLELGVVGSPIGFAAENGGTRGGLGGAVVTARTLAELQRYASAPEPHVILVEGTISNGATGAKVSVGSNKSIVGIGSSAFLEGVGLDIANSNDVIVQNLTITLVGTSNPNSVNGGDAIVIRGTSKNVWIDHCEIYSEDPSVQTDIDKYDGLIDVRDQTGFITISWNYLHDHHKGLLVGSSETDLHDDRKITFHHNYFRKIIKRMPMYRGSTGHFFNNYVVGTSATEASFMLMGTCVRIERNVYETVKYSIYTQTGATQGSAERIDNLETQSRAYPPNCSANIPYGYADAVLDVSEVKARVQAGAGVGKL